MPPFSDIVKIRESCQVKSACKGERVVGRSNVPLPRIHTSEATIVKIDDALSTGAESSNTISIRLSFMVFHHDKAGSDMQLRKEQAYQMYPRVQLSA